jgi:hypothetical protein
MKPEKAMEFFECPREAEAMAAARLGSLPEELCAHVAGCAACANAVAISQFLASGSDSVTVPPAGLVWWKAQLRIRQEAADRALRPIRWAEQAAAVIGLAAASGAIAWAVASSPLLAAASVASVILLLGSAGSVLYMASGRR